MGRAVLLALCGVVAGSPADAARLDSERMAACDDEAPFLSGLAVGIEDGVSGIERPGEATLLTSCATALLAAPGAGWWWDGAERSSQRWLAPGGAGLPRQGALESAVGPTAESAVGWWSPPLHGAIMTSRGPVAGVPAAGLVGMEDPPGDVTWDVWRVDVRPEARIYEISEPGNWADLVTTYPRDVTGRRGKEWRRWTGVGGRWFLPDWPAVGRHWDGVHVSVGGYLTTARRVVPAAGGSTYLAGWDPDLTLWMRDRFGAAERVARWTGRPGVDALGGVELPWIRRR